MNAQRLKQLLDQVGAQAFPEDPNAWSAIQKRLASRRSALRQSPSRRTMTLRISAGIGLAMCILIVSFVVVPNQQALAEAWNHFFRIASADQLPTPNSSALATPTYPPTFAVTLVPLSGMAATSASLPTPTGLYSSTGDACGINSYNWSYACWLAYAEKKAGFTAKQLPSDLKAFTFSQVSVAVPGKIELLYQAIDGNGDLIFSQWNENGFSTLHGGVPDSAIEEVKVGNNPGEYVTGDWATQSKDPKVYWNACCRYTLRWLEDGRDYEIMLDADPSPYSSREAIIQLATQVTYDPLPQVGPRADDLTSLSEASQLADFTILSPTRLPEGFIFRYGTFDRDISQLKLVYALPGVEGLAGATLTVTESPLDKLALAPGENGEDIKGQTVAIAGQNGIYFMTPDHQDYTVTWQTDKLRITLQVSTNSGYGGIFTQEDILAIARSIK